MITWSISAILESEEVLLVTFDQFTVSTAELFRIWGEKLFQIILYGGKKIILSGEHENSFDGGLEENMGLSSSHNQPAKWPTFLLQHTNCID